VVLPTTQPLFIPTVTPTRSPESFLSDAENLMNQGKMNQAIQAYRIAIQANPRNGTSYVTLARLLIYTGQYTDAVTNAENALLLNPNNSIAHAVRGWALAFEGEYLLAEGAMKKAIELEPNNGIAYAYYAEVLILQNQAGQGTLGTIDKAVEASRQAATLAPNTLEAYRARGIVLENTQNYLEASKEFEGAIAANPNIADLHLALGRNYRALEMYDKAVEEFNRANALNPTDPMPNTLISRTYATVGEYAKAVQFAQQAVKTSPSDPYMNGNLGVMYYRDHTYKDAVKYLRLAVRGGVADDNSQVEGLPLDYGRIAEYYYIYGLALARNGECGEALQISQAVQQGVPNDETAIYNAAEMINICKELIKATSTPPAEQTTTPVPTAKPTTGGN
jgi:tetratricopeptide (TPR) repeat protein